MPLDNKFEELMQSMQRFEAVQNPAFITEPVETSPLTPHQEEIKQSILASMRQGHKKHILAGSAGVGKTFLVKYLIREFRKTIRTFGEVYITAPTNRAVAVLHDKDPEAPYYMEFKTVHSTLFLKRKINDKTGETTFVPDYNPTRQRPLKGVSLLIVDESSMLNSELLYYLENPEYISTFILFLGDNKQLNPVNETHSPIFRRPGLDGQVISVIIAGEPINHLVPHYETYELTEIIRQASGNPIIHLSRNLQNISLLENSLNEEGHGYTYTSDAEFVIKKIIEDGDKVRYLAWTNAEVDSTNTTVRNRIYGHPSKIEQGEYIVFSEPYEGRTTGNLYYTNYELEIKTKDIKVETFYVLRGFKPNDGGEAVDFSIELSYYWVNRDIMVIHEENYYRLLDTIKYLKSLTKRGLPWSTVIRFSEMFLKFKYRYALTVHTAQGGTFDTAIIHMRDVNKNRSVHERPRLWYTAITRASKNVIMYNPLTTFKT